MGQPRGKNIHINKTPCLHLKFCFCHSRVDLAKYVSKLNPGYNVQQFSTEESGTKIRSVEGVLAILKGVNNVWQVSVRKKVGLPIPLTNARLSRTAEPPWSPHD